MTTTNNITGEHIHSRHLSDKGRENYDRIFGKTTTAPLTLDMLRAALASVTPQKQQCYFLRQDVKTLLENETAHKRPTDPLPIASILGFDVYVKEGQQAQCIVIESKIIAKAYLEGTITEEMLQENMVDVAKEKARDQTPAPMDGEYDTETPPLT